MPANSRWDLIRRLRVKGSMIFLRNAQISNFMQVNAGGDKLSHVDG